MSPTDSELPNSISFSRRQIDLIKTTICRGATDDELSLFIATCQRLRLDPFARQIFAVKRWDAQARKEVMAIQVSIDGFRLTAERSGRYRGQLGPYWCGEDRVWRDVWVERDPPVAAKVGVLKEGFSEPIFSPARFDAFAQRKKDGNLVRMWETMHDHMLAKCAEALSLRRAFPFELSNVYLPEELGVAEHEEPTYVAPAPPTPAISGDAPASLPPGADVEAGVGETGEPPLLALLIKTETAISNANSVEDFAAIRTMLTALPKGSADRERLTDFAMQRREELGIAGQR